MNESKTGVVLGGIAFVLSLAAIGLVLYQQTQLRAAQQDVASTLASMQAVISAQRVAINNTVETATANSVSSTAGLNPLMAPTTTAMDYSHSYQWKLSFEYPKSYSVETAVNDFRPLGMNLRITSMPGSLFRSAGGPAQPLSGEFVSGYEMSITQIANAQQAVDDVQGKLVATTNPLVQELRFVCDGVGCDQAQYIITSKTGVYLVHVNSSDVDYSEVMTITKRILESMQEK